jgi:alpha-glucosidase
MKQFIFPVIILLFSIACQAQPVRLISPDGKMQVFVYPSPNLAYSIQYNGKEILKKSRIAMQINDGFMLGVDQQLVKKQAISITRNIEAVVPTRFSIKRAFYKGMIFTFRVSNLRAYNVEFRVYNDAVAYRFVPDFGNDILIEDETVELNFPPATFCYYPELKSFISHYEPLYKKVSLDTVSQNSMAMLPILMQVNGTNVLFTEVNVYNYPNLFLKPAAPGMLKGVFSKMVKETRPDPKSPDRNEKIVRTKRQIAITFGKRSMPWRVFLISDKDADLIQSNTPVALADENKFPHRTSWIKPGKVVWDWYSANNIYKKYRVNEINTETYKYYIDFAAKYGIEYVLMDEGWSKSTLRITEPKDNIDMKEIIAYGKQHNVGIILWMLWKPLDDDLEYTLDTYRKWGIKGIKVDFMQRADQDMVEFYERVAKEAFKDSLIVDFHGSYKPAGMNITYPNVLSFEGVKGNENNKWSDVITPEHTLEIPFIRMASGPMDFTPGAMANAQAKNFSISWNEPVSIGTRSRQVAMYVVYESALQMLCDAPSRYEKVPDVTRFISRIPTTWDETKVLEAKVGSYLVIARRKGKRWYLAAMTDNQERQFKIKLSDFLPSGYFMATTMEDGPEANTNAEDYIISETTVERNKPLIINMVKGGAYIAIFSPVSHGSTNKKSKRKKKKTTK